MSREVQLTVVVDNQASGSLQIEHGFAAWLAVGGECYLLDTGAGSALAANAGALGIDLSCAKALVLSHGHYDHSGGIIDFLASNSDAKLYCGHGAERTRYSCHADVPVRGIGMCEAAVDSLQHLPLERIRVLGKPCLLADGIGVTGPVPRRCAFEDTGGPFYLDPDKQSTDLISDDQAIWLETTAGLVIITGCCHAGLVNTVEYVQQITGVERVHGIVGGLHLLQASSLRMANTVEALRKWAPDFLIPCHCSGEAALKQLQEAFGANTVLPGYAGLSFGLGELACSRPAVNWRHE